MYCFANGVNARNTAKVAHGEIVYKWLIFSSDKCAKSSTNADWDDPKDEDEDDLIENEPVIVWNSLDFLSRVSLPLFIFFLQKERERENEKEQKRFASDVRKKWWELTLFNQHTPSLLLSM